MIGYNINQGKKKLRFDIYKDNFNFMNKELEKFNE